MLSERGRERKRERETKEMVREREREREKEMVREGGKEGGKEGKTGYYSECHVPVCAWQTASSGRGEHFGISSFDSFFLLNHLLKTFSLFFGFFFKLLPPLSNMCHRIRCIIGFRYIYMALKYK